jgi:hypothetical protein
MRGSEETSRAGRLAAIATLAVSAALFLTALFGIASIDPSADAAQPVPTTPAEPDGAPARSVSLDVTKHSGDCPWRRNGAGASGVAS